MSDVNPQFLLQVTKIAAALDSLDYFQLLRIETGASTLQIREGYHAQSRQFHPDRYHHFGLPELVRDLTTITKRITEAYVCLRDEQKRERYRKLVEGPDRDGNLRYDETQESEQRAEKQAELGKTLQGRKMYNQASAAWMRGDKEEAVKNLKMALLYEKDNEKFKQLVDEWTGGGGE